MQRFSCGRRIWAALEGCLPEFGRNRGGKAGIRLFAAEKGSHTIAILLVYKRESNIHDIQSHFNLSFCQGALTHMVVFSISSRYQYSSDFVHQSAGNNEQLSAESWYQDNIGFSNQCV